MTPAGASLVWDPRFREYDFGAGHPFTERSRALAVRLLDFLYPPERSNRLERLGPIDPASPETLGLFHRPDYLRLVRTASAAEESILLDAGDTPAFPGCYDASARVVAGADRALRSTLANGRPALHPAGGLHHAHPGRASGFCVFNDVAVAVARALQEGLRVAYLDIDAHHGDGVMYGFYDSGRVLDIDFHQDGRTLFPGTGFPSETGRGDGARAKVNVPFPPSAGDEALVPMFRRIVPPLVRSFRPEVIVLQHGVDGHVGDALAQLQYTGRGYTEVDRIVLSLAEEVCGGRLVVTGGGGYRAAAVSRVLARAAATVAGDDPPAADRALPPEWCDEYRRSLGEAPPRTWGEAPTPGRSVWRSEDATKLVGVLESELGVRFPSTEEPTDERRRT